MGGFTPDGIGEKPRTENQVKPDDAVVFSKPTDEIVNTDLNIDPLELLTDILVNFGAIAREYPAESEKMTNALREEIFDAFGITENNPETINPNIETRIGALAEAVMSNEPEEIKAASEALFNGAIDSPERLNQLAGYMLAQNGGHLAGLSIGGKNPFEEAQLKARRETERSMNIAAASIAAAALAQAQAEAKIILDNYYLQNEEFYNNLLQNWSDKHQSGNYTSEEVGNGMAEDNADKAWEQYLELKAEGKLTDEEIFELIAERFGEEILSDGRFNQNIATAAENSTTDYLRDRLSAEKGLALSKHLEGHSIGFAGLTNLVFNIQTDNDYGFESVQSKADLENIINDTFTSFEVGFTKSEQELVDIQKAIEEQRIVIEQATLGLVAADGVLIERRLEELLKEQELLNQLESDLSEFTKTLNLQKEVTSLLKNEVNNMVNGLEDDLSNFDKEFVKNALLGMSPDLIEKSMELQNLLGLEAQDPIASLLSMAEEQLNPNEYSEVLQFANEVKEAKAAMMSAQDLQAQAEQNLEQAHAMDPDGVGATIPSLTDTFSAVAPMDGSNLGFAMEERKQALTELANLRAGTELEGAALEQAIYEEAILQAVGADGTINQSEINETLTSLGMYGDELNNAQNRITAFLANNHGVTVIADIAAEMDIQDAPAPEPPEVIAARIAGMAEQKVWEEVMDAGLTTISKEEIMTRLEEKGINGELLISSTEQLIADFQNDIGENAVTGLEYPQSVAEQYNIGENIAPVIGEPAPEEEPITQKPASYDPNDPQYQNTGGTAPMV